MNLKLTALAVKNLTNPGLYNDGAGLYLKVSKSGTKSWIFRWRDRTTGKLRDMGLGPVGDYSLKEAREAATEARKLVSGGFDPIVERKRERLARRTQTEGMLTFDECAERYILTHEPTWKNPKHIGQWRNTLRDYASPIIGELPVNSVADHHVLAILEPLWSTKTETGSRVRSRLERILDWATAHKYRDGANPARWKGHLAAMLPSPSKIKNVQHHPSLPYPQVYDFIEEIREHAGNASRCLEFTILTAARTKESIGAQWSEIDFAARIWTVPGVRMKGKIEHRVPLSDTAIEVLKGQRDQNETFVFPGLKDGKHLSDAAMMELVKDLKTTYRDKDGRRIVVHGFRSTFRNFSGEQTNFPREVCEASMAHKLKDKTEAAYFTSDLLEKRAALIGQWATYCLTKPKKATVTPIKSSAT